MFTSISRVVDDHRRLVVILGIVAVVAAAVFGGGVASRLTNGGFTDPGSESATADRLLEEEFGTTEPNLVLLVSAGDVDEPEVVSAGMELTSELASEADVADVVSYWSLDGAAPQPRPQSRRISPPLRRSHSR
jgi:RND superfamily putative drug exporter